MIVITTQKETSEDVSYSRHASCFFHIFIPRSKLPVWNIPLFPLDTGQKGLWIIGFNIRRQRPFTILANLFSNKPVKRLLRWSLLLALTLSTNLTHTAFHENCHKSNDYRLLNAKQALMWNEDDYCARDPSSSPIQMSIFWWYL